MACKPTDPLFSFEFIREKEEKRKWGGKEEGEKGDEEREEEEEEEVVFLIFCKRESVAFMAHFLALKDWKKAEWCPKMSNTIERENE